LIIKIVLYIPEVCKSSVNAFMVHKLKNTLKVYELESRNIPILNIECSLSLILLDSDINYESLETQTVL